MYDVRRGTFALVLILGLQACGGGGADQSQTYTNGGALSEAPRSGPPADGAGSVNTYTVGGTVTGLAGAGLVLEDNAGHDLPVAANGIFAFPVAQPNGSTYVITIRTQPAARREFCVLANASGTISNANVTSVTVNCATASGFLFAAYTDPANQIVAYGINSESGALMPIGSPVAAGSATWALVAAPSGQFLYATNYGSNSISVFSVDSNTGALAAVGSPISTGSHPENLIITPSGSFLYVYNVAAGTVTTYAVDSVTGALTLAGLPLAFGGEGAIDFAMKPDGKFLYILDERKSTIDVFAIDATTGTLTITAVAVPGANASAMAVDPLGHFLYVANEGPTTPSSPSADIVTYAINASTGAITAVGPGVSIASNASSLTADPSGRYLYVVDDFNFGASNDSLAAFSIDRTSGALTQIGMPVLNGSSVPGFVECDPSGRFVYVENQGAVPGDSVWFDVSGYAIDMSSATPGLPLPVGFGTQLNAGQALLWGPKPMTIVE
jgi:6-phosphogluconolactonase